MKMFCNMLLLVLLLDAMAAAACAQGQAPASTATQQPSRAQQLMGATAPKLAELTDDVLYADIWERPQLCKRDRSLITVTALIVLNRPDSCARTSHSPARTA
jgi:4-carboxymuconolactone decarboxylase